MWPFSQTILRPVAHYGLPEVRSARLLLRPLTIGDAAMVFFTIDRNRDEFSRWFTWSRNATPSSIHDGLRSAAGQMMDGTDWHYAIFERRSGSFVGRIGIADINQKARTAELGYWLSREHAAQGYMTEAVRAMVLLATERADDVRINAYADVENAGSRRVLEKVGFRRVRTIMGAVNHPERGWRNHEHYQFTPQMIEREDLYERQ